MAVRAQTTGERPGEGPGYDYDESRHLAAYRYARGLAHGLRVLDAGCGEGFGTRILSPVAAEVVGVDYAPDAIAACRARWDEPNLRFVQADLTTDHVPGSYDLVTNFQVLEHVADEIGFLERLAGLLAPGGTLLLTTPNVRRSFSENPYHLREYTADELRGLLGRVFGDVTVLGMHGNAKVAAFDRERERAVRRVLALDPWGLRHRLPERLCAFAFARLSVVVRMAARRGSGTGRILPQDFTVRADDVDGALDLVAVCRPVPPA